MCSSSPDRLFGRQRSLHEILGGGIAADVILWRRKDVTVGILLGTLSAWVVFELSGYTLLSFISRVLLLLLSILFVWAKAANVLNRPSPPLPKLYISEEIMSEVGLFMCSQLNSLFSVSCEIALGKNTRLFFKVAAYLWLLSIVGSLADFLTLGYTCLVLALSLPALYEKYEYQIDKHLKSAYLRLHHVYGRLDILYFSKIRKWILEKRKLN